MDQKRVLIFFLLNDGCQIPRRVSDGLDQSVTWQTMCQSTIDRGKRKRESPIVLQDFGYNKIAGEVQCSNQIVEKFKIFEEKPRALNQRRKRASADIRECYKGSLNFLRKTKPFYLKVELCVG